MNKSVTKKPMCLASRNSILALVTAFSLTGCGLSETALDTTYVPVHGSQQFPIEVAKGPVTLEVSSKNGTLRPNQINSVSAFARSAMGNGYSKLTLRRPAGGGNSARVASEVSSLLSQMGISKNMIQQSTYPASSNSPVQISYVRTYAKTKPCAAESEDLSETASNASMLNHGCSVQSNIAAMVVNPETFELPSPVTPAPAATRMPGLAMDAGGAASTPSP